MKKWANKNSYQLESGKAYQSVFAKDWRLIKIISNKKFVTACEKLREIWVLENQWFVSKLGYFIEKVYNDLIS